jgi:hypothetical protein
MEELGLSKVTIIRLVILSVWILMLMFLFIFFGIMGFTTTSSLGSVVNALFPLIGGSLLGFGTAIKAKDKIKRILPTIFRVLRVLTISDL